MNTDKSGTQGSFIEKLNTYKQKAEACFKMMKSDEPLEFYRSSKGRTSGFMHESSYLDLRNSIEMKALKVDFKDDNISDSFKQRRAETGKNPIFAQGTEIFRREMSEVSQRIQKLDLEEEIPEPEFANSPTPARMPSQTPRLQTHSPSSSNSCLLMDSYPHNVKPIRVPTLPSVPNSVSYNKISPVAIRKSSSGSQKESGVVFDNGDSEIRFSELVKKSSTQEIKQNQESRKKLEQVSFDKSSDKQDHKSKPSEVPFHYSSSRGKSQSRESEKTPVIVKRDITIDSNSFKSSQKVNSDPTVSLPKKNPERAQSGPTSGKAQLILKDKPIFSEIQRVDKSPKSEIIVSFVGDVPINLISPDRQVEEGSKEHLNESNPICESTGKICPEEVFGKNKKIEETVLNGQTSPAIIPVGREIDFGVHSSRNSDPMFVQDQSQSNPYDKSSKNPESSSGSYLLKSSGETNSIEKKNMILFPNEIDSQLSSKDYPSKLTFHSNTNKCLVIPKLTQSQESAVRESLVNEIVNPDSRESNFNSPEADFLLKQFESGEILMEGSADNYASVNSQDSVQGKLPSLSIPPFKIQPSIISPTSSSRPAPNLNTNYDDLPNYEGNEEEIDIVDISLKPEEKIPNSKEPNLERPKSRRSSFNSSRDAQIEEGSGTIRLLGPSSEEPLGASQDLATLRKKEPREMILDCIDLSSPGDNLIQVNTNQTEIEDLVPTGQISFCENFTNKLEASNKPGFKAESELEKIASPRNINNSGEVNPPTNNSNELNNSNSNEEDLFLTTPGEKSDIITSFILENLIIEALSEDFCLPKFISILGPFHRAQEEASLSAYLDALFGLIKNNHLEEVVRRLNKPIGHTDIQRLMLASPVIPESDQESIGSFSYEPILDLKLYISLEESFRETVYREKSLNGFDMEKEHILHKMVFDSINENMDYRRKGGVVGLTPRFFSNCQEDKSLTEEVCSQLLEQAREEVLAWGRYKNGTIMEKEPVFSYYGDTEGLEAVKEKAMTGLIKEYVGFDYRRLDSPI